MRPIYLDNNSTTEMLPAVREGMQRYWREGFGNPASAHRAGRAARRALEDAREQCAAILGAFPDEVVFTSGATEANNLALFGLCGEPPGRILTTPIEHPSVWEPVSQLGRMGFDVDLVPVDSEGVVCEAAFADLIKLDTRLVAVMLANNETGAVQPVQRLATALAGNTPFHCDAVQAVGKIPVDFHALGVTTLSLSAHKSHGPAGIGALLIRRGQNLAPRTFGGHQQQGRRPGTEPVALALGLAIALDLAYRERQLRCDRVERLRDLFLELLGRDASPVVLNGPKYGGVPHSVNVSFPGCQADSLLMNLDLAGVACSTGSACSSGSLLPSPVLRAMGLPDELLHSAMRFSLSHLLSEEDIVEAVNRISRIVRRLRNHQ
jgi:cysteine desulfurase